MSAQWSSANGAPVARGRLRSNPEDFQVSEELGFELSGEGEHAFLQLQKRELNTVDLVQRLSRLSGVGQRDIGYSGLKDRNAVTDQWLSVGLAGRPEPDWSELEQDSNIRVLQVQRHRRKLKRGVHSANRFKLMLRELEGKQAAIEERLQNIREQGAPNYFGEQRFGRNGSTLSQGRAWALGGGRSISRNKRSLYLSAIRSFLFNCLLARRVVDGDWNRIRQGDTCMLQGSRSLFTCEELTQELQQRAQEGDLHPGLPLWGRGALEACPQARDVLGEHKDIYRFLEEAGLDLSWRSARLLADDFSWQFCDDCTLQLDFALGAGSYATALLAEFVQTK